ncbi:hypothetical protein ACJJTC_000520 [Scirpophaga incertulas]
MSCEPRASVYTTCWARKARRRAGIRKTYTRVTCRDRSRRRTTHNEVAAKGACSRDSVTTDDCDTTRLFPMVNILRSRGRRPHPGGYICAAAYDSLPGSEEALHPQELSPYITRLVYFGFPCRF